MSDHSPETARVTLDDAAQDVFGLNIRGLKSIWLVWTHPRRYFAAAATPDWQGKYTPSIRLWLSLVALMSLLQFIWIGTNTPLVGVYAQGYKDAGVVLAEGVTYEDLGEQAALWIHGLTPLIQAAGLLLIAFLFRYWGRNTTFALRQRYVFATVIPSASLVLFLLPSMRMMSMDVVSWFGWVIAAIAVSVDFSTAIRGPFRDRETRSKLWRAGLLAGVILFSNFVIAILVQIGGIIMVSVRYGLTVG